MRFSDRADAGQQLAQLLKRRGLEGQNVVVLGLPRGGVPVAFEVSQALDAPLDVIVVRKLGVPFQPELAMGAIGEGGVRILNDDVLRMAMVDGTELALVERRERIELERRARRFREDRPPVAIRGRTVVVVDDGMATGASARAACEVARAQGAVRVLMAVPVASRSAVEELAKVCDGVLALEAPDTFYAVGAWYEDFSPTSDREVVTLLRRSATGSTTVPAMASTGDDPPVRDEEVELRAGNVRLAGQFTVPEVLKGMVVFAHGSGSSRHSPRNRFVASALNEAGLGTLLFDLLGADEEHDRSRVFDIPLLAGRLMLVTTWLAAQPESAGSRIGYFGASTGAAAALWAAAQSTVPIAAVVSRGGRPDLAMSVLREVRSPTLLIVGGHDEVVLDLNRRAQKQLRCENRLAVVPGATHLFDEPGTLKEAATLARQWFVHHLAPLSHSIT